MPFALSHHRRPRSANTPSAAATVFYMVTMLLLMAVVESACLPAISHASLHQGEGIAWIVWVFAVYRLGSRYHYPNGAFLFGMASALVFVPRYLTSMPIRRAYRGGVEINMAETLVFWFIAAFVLGLFARMIACMALPLLNKTGVDAPAAQPGIFDPR